MTDVPQIHQCVLPAWQIAAWKRASVREEAAAAESRAIAREAAMQAGGR